MNAKQEFIKHVGGKEVESVIIMHEVSYSEPLRKLVLPKGFNAQNYNEFLDLLDFDYDSGYGAQELEGTIWYTDGTWSGRAEYDGSEWWAHYQRPGFDDTYQRMKNFR